MKQVYQDFLFERFSQFFPSKEKRTPERTAMAWGFAVGDGWFELIYNLLKNIEKLAKENPEQYLTFEVKQIKEKFGGLRFYIDGYISKLPLDTIEQYRIYMQKDPLEKLIRRAEMESFQICEDCGRSGKLREDRLWLRTLCDECGKLDLDPKRQREQRKQAFEQWKALNKKEGDKK